MLDEDQNRLRHQLFWKGMSMNLVCPFCNKSGEVDVRPQEGQRVFCPECNRKFLYSEIDEERINRPDFTMFDKDDILMSLSYYRKQPEYEKLYIEAPHGARMYYTLLFYGKMFGSRLDNEQYLAEFTEVEDLLRARDIRYLMRNETQADIIAHFNDLLNVCRAEGDTDDSEFIRVAAAQARASDANSAPPGGNAPSSATEDDRNKYNRQSASQQSGKIQSVCPYCGAREMVDRQFVGAAATCDECGNDFVIGRKIQINRGNQARQSSAQLKSEASPNPIISFVLGFLGSIIGVLIAILIDKRNLKPALWGLAANIVLFGFMICMIGGLTYCCRAVGRKADGATEALSSEEGAKAKAAAEEISEDSIKEIGEN